MIKTYAKALEFDRRHPPKRTDIPRFVDPMIVCSKERRWAIDVLRTLGCSVPHQWQEQ